MTQRLGVRLVFATVLGVLGAGVRAGPARADLTMQIGTVQAAPGQRVDVPAVLHTDGVPLSIFQTDLLFELQTAPVSRNGRPDCRQTPDLLPGLLGSRFTFAHDLCGAGDDCAAVRGQVGASGQAFPDDVVVYTCAVRVAADAAPGSYAVRCVTFDTSNADGNAVGGTCSDGAIEVVGQPVPTPTVSAPPNVSPTATLAPVETPVLEVSSASGRPGDRVSVDVRLRTAGVRISGVQVDIGFSPSAAIIAGATGRPDCTYGTDPNIAGFSSLGFQPPFCVDDCSALRGILLTAEIEPIPDGDRILSCTVDIAADAEAGVYPLPLSNLGGSTPEGQWVDLAGSAGSITVVRPPSEDQRPVSSGGGASAAGGGCAIATAAPGTGTWLLAIGALAFGLLRRRARR